MKRNVTQYTLEGGEADPVYERRADSDLWQLTCQRARNVRLINGGGCKRRPGLARVLTLAGTARTVPFVARDGTSRFLIFRSGAMDVMKDDETIEATITGPWATGQLSTLQFAQYDDTVYVTNRGFFPQQVAFASGAFSNAANLAFETGPDGEKYWPYYRDRSTRGIKITPSGVTGAITLTASAALFTAGWVGLRLQINGREVEITAYTDSTHVNATVIQTLRQTVRITVASTAGFAAAQAVQTSVDDIEMEVASVVSATQLDCILVDTFTSPTAASNNLLGPNGSSAISAVAAAPANGATLRWFEPLISSLRGYPGGCAVHKQRLCLLDFPAYGELHALSTIATPLNFDTGDAEDDQSIQDGPGDIPGKRARWVVSAEQLISLTEGGAYYVGEAPNAPVTPTTSEFLRIGPEPIGSCNPVLAQEGVVYAETQGDRLILLAPTGQLRRVWGGTEILAASSEIFDRPGRLLLVDGCEWGPERYILVINHDGSICCVHYRRDNDLAGATLWETPGGEFVDVAVFGRKIYAVVNRDGSYRLERFDVTRLLDDSVIVNNGAGSTPTDPAFVSRSDVALVLRRTVDGELRRVDLGTLYTGTAGGVLTGAPTTARNYEGGTRFPVQLTLWSPIDPQEGPSRHVRIARASIDVLESGHFYAMGQAFTAYRAADDVTDAPPLRTGWRRRSYLGRKRDINFEITQVEAAPLTIRAITLEVA